MHYHFTQLRFGFDFLLFERFGDFLVDLGAVCICVENVLTHEHGFGLEYLGGSKIENNCFGKSWSRPPGSSTMKMRALRVS